jgi:hypothetical protein
MREGLEVAEMIPDPVKEYHECDTHLKRKHDDTVCSKWFGRQEADLVQISESQIQRKRYRDDKNDEQNFRRELVFHGRVQET